MLKKFCEDSNPNAPLGENEVPIGCSPREIVRMAPPCKRVKTSKSIDNKLPVKGKSRRLTAPQSDATHAAGELVIPFSKIHLYRPINYQVETKYFNVYNLDYIPFVTPLNSMKLPNIAYCEETKKFIIVPNRMPENDDINMGMLSPPRERPYDYDSVAQCPDPSVLSAQFSLIKIPKPCKIRHRRKGLGKSRFNSKPSTPPSFAFCGYYNNKASYNTNTTNNNQGFIIPESPFDLSPSSTTYTKGPFSGKFPSKSTSTSTFGNVPKPDAEQNLPQPAFDMNATSRRCYPGASNRYIESGVSETPFILSREPIKYEDGILPGPSSAKDTYIPGLFGFPQSRDDYEAKKLHPSPPKIAPFISDQGTDPLDIGTPRSLSPAQSMYPADDIDPLGLPIEDEPSPQCSPFNGSYGHFEDHSRAGAVNPIADQFELGSDPDTWNSAEDRRRNFAPTPQPYNEFCTFESIQEDHSYWECFRPGQMTESPSRVEMQSHYELPAENNNQEGGIPEANNNVGGPGTAAAVAATAAALAPAPAAAPAVAAATGNHFEPNLPVNNGQWYLLDIEGNSNCE